MFSGKKIFASNLSHTPLHLIFLTNLLALMPFNLKLEQLIYKKVLKIVLLDN